MSAILRMNGWDVVRVPDGVTALTLARQARHDLLITDWNIAGLRRPRPLYQLSQRSDAQDRPYYSGFVAQVAR
ncbi:DNA-binding response OmpR family regulator [Paraburkholderia sp. WC7.3g]|uniref:hypothetical protein n=1 Tax=Paraburkholderia sp. WC7.3g TaxID=2991070 RepID=UPI003D19B684